MILELFLTATYYAGAFLGRQTASGQVFDSVHYTAAVSTFRMGQEPYPVTITRGQRKLVVMINDRCPIENRIDLSPAAAKYLGIWQVGKGKVLVRGLRPRRETRVRSPTVPVP
jgi:rare lipoprotein A